VLPDSLACLKLGGRLVILGYNYGIPLSVDTADLIYGQWSILGTRASSLQDVVEVVKLVEQRRLKPVVSELYPLQEVEQALAKLRESPPLGRIVLHSGV
jgi:D-arabinose 1-dehydrogenase-like Zn-dependent alcohol dehydrogenase